GSEANGNRLASREFEYWPGNAGNQDRPREQIDSGAWRGRIVLARCGARWREVTRRESAWRASRAANISPVDRHLAGRFQRSGGAYRRSAAVSVARTDDRLRPAFYSAGRDQAQPGRNGSGEDECLSLAPFGQSGVPHGEQKISEAARAGLGRSLLHARRDSRRDR